MLWEHIRFFRVSGLHFDQFDLLYSLHYEAHFFVPKTKLWYSSKLDLNFYPTLLIIIAFGFSFRSAARKYNRLITNNRTNNKMYTFIRHLFICLMILLASCLTSVSGSSHDGGQRSREDDKPCPDKPPNIIVIVADDMVNENWIQCFDCDSYIQMLIKNFIRICWNDILFKLIDRDSMM